MERKVALFQSASVIILRIKRGKCIKHSLQFDCAEKNALLLHFLVPLALSLFITGNACVVCYCSSEKQALYAFDARYGRGETVITVAKFSLQFHGGERKEHALLNLMYGSTSNL